MQDSVQAELARVFAEHCVANWNYKDVEAVLKFFSRYTAVKQRSNAMAQSWDEKRTDE